MRLKKQISGLPPQQATLTLPPQLSNLSKAMSLECRTAYRTISDNATFLIDILPSALAFPHFKRPLITNLQLSHSR